MPTTSLPTILHVSTIKSWGGGEQQLVYLYQELAKQPLQQLILCHNNSALAQLSQARNFNYLTFQGSGSINFKLAWQLAMLCRKQTCTIIHAHDSHALTAALLARLLFRCSAKLVVSRKVAFPIGKSWLSRYKYQTKHISQIICISQAVRNIVAQTVPDSAKLTVIYDGVDVSRFTNSQLTTDLRQALHCTSETILIGTIASLVPSKDLFTFLATAKQLLQQGLQTKFLIIGDGPQKSDLQVFATQEKIAEHILFMGFRADIPTLLPQLDIFMFTSKQEGMGSVLLEAMACQVPIVATRVGGIPEIVEDQVTGLLAEVGDTKGLAQAVNKLLQNPKTRQQLVSRAKHQLTNFSIDTMARNTLAVYTQVTSKC